ncbi:MAG TPA: hypothetical protein VGF25_07775 [Thermoleophilaceae bacterium]
MAVVEALHRREPLGAEPHARPVALEEGPAETAAGGEAGQVAGRGGHPDDADQRQQVDPAARRHDAPHDHGGLARGEQSDEGRRLEERERGHDRVGPGTEGAGGVLERAVEVWERHDGHEHDDGGDRRDSTRA